MLPSLMLRPSVYYTCPHCGSYLIPQVAKGGQAPGSTYIRCANHTPPYFMRLSPMAGPLPSVSKPAGPMLAPPIQSSSTGTTELKPACAWQFGCISSRVPRLCTHKMCKKHCNLTGVCDLGPHERARKEKLREAAATQPAPPSAPSAPQPNYDPLLQIARSLSYETLRPLHALQDWQTAHNSQIVAQNRMLDTAIGGFDPPSPGLTVEEELQRQLEQEASDHALALRLSQEEARSLREADVSRIGLPSPSPPPIAGPSRLRSLTVSPNLPPTLLSLPPPAHGRAAAPADARLPGTEGLAIFPFPARDRATALAVTGPKPPRRRVQAPSVQSKNRQLNITTQLNDTWMSVGSQSSSTEVTPVTSVRRDSDLLHIRQGPGRRPFADRRQIQRFTLLFFTGGDEPILLSVDGSDLSGWPSYQLADDEKTLEALRADKTLAGLDTDLHQLDMFLHRQRMWMGIDINHLHTVSTDCILILRPRGIRGPNDTKIISTFLPEEAPAHLRYNLPRERAAVRATLKERSSTKEDNDSDSDVEIVTSVGLQKGKKREPVRDCDSEAAPRPRQRPRLSITTTIPARGSSSAPITIDSPPPSALSLTSVGRSSSLSSMPSSPIPSSATDRHGRRRQQGVKPSWPYGMYVVDMAQGFIDMDSPAFKTQRLHRGERFTRVFKATYKPSTYDNQFQLWTRASDELKDEAVKAGRSPAGLWSIFRKNVNRVQGSNGGEQEEEDEEGIL
ncbi:hypothetical protein B0H11DRAFT_2012127 [Mycena galericulata]|nr:hypothetical protein B0H11DRAFT_2015246 [Mycena galericulata]KAJ7489706.1 hypothetical protein B0H11DRAFT_2012127 [Mycena galericulata]